MLRWTLLVLALCAVAFASLTAIEAPAWSAWQLAVAAGEYGHFLVPLPLALGVAAWLTRRNHRRFAAISVTFSIGAAGLLLKPCFQAARLAPDVRTQLARQFGDAAIPRAPFSFAGLFAADPGPVSPEMLNVSAGLPLDFYRAIRTDRRPAPCVVIVHGGGWDAGDRKQIPQFNHWLARGGYAVAAISYRLAPTFQWPAQRDDVLASIAFLKGRARELGVDPNRFVLLGRSAGGQIAQTVGYVAHDPAIRGVVGLYAPSDLLFGYVHTHENDMIKSPSLMRQYLGGPPEAARANYESASALFHVMHETPPTLLLHGANDALVWHRHSVRLEAKLREYGVPSVFVSLPWATHAFDYNLRGPGGQLTLFAVEWFLAAVTR